nr:MAG TPA: hypothetical protein [Bacteriophage sp.]
MKCFYFCRYSLLPERERILSIEPSPFCGRRVM